MELWYAEVLYTCLRFINAPNRRRQRALTIMYTILLSIILVDEFHLLAVALYKIFLAMPFLSVTWVLHLLINSKRVSNVIYYEIILLWLRYLLAPFPGSRTSTYAASGRGCLNKLKTIANELSSTSTAPCVRDTLNQHHGTLKRNNYRFWLTVVLTVIGLVVYRNDKTSTVAVQLLSSRRATVQ